MHVCLKSSFPCLLFSLSSELPDAGDLTQPIYTLPFNGIVLMLHSNLISPIHSGLLMNRVKLTLSASLKASYTDAFDPVIQIAHLFVIFLTI